MTDAPRPAPLTVALVAVPESTPATLYGLHEVLGSACVTWPLLMGGPPGVARLRPVLVAASREPFASPVGLPIAPEATLAEVPRADVVIVADLALPGDLDPKGRWPEVGAWLRAQYEGGAIVCAVCTGAVLLASAGLLDGVEATTHWSAADYLRRHFPDVRLRPERILLPTGPEHRIVTCGGSAAWEDLALYLITRFCGREEAVRTAKLYVFGDRSEGQALYAAMGRGRRHEDAAIARAQEWISEHYAEEHPVQRMAAAAGLGERTFARRFRAATGYAPVDYVQALRIEEAKQLLETTDLGTEDIAAAVGYQDPAFFRRLFKRRTGVTPARYRQRFGAVPRALTTS
jgi:transcriptional regulator GlxA family with amidase domain